MKVFVTTMHRYPEIYRYEGHSYVSYAIGVFSSKEKAEKGGRDEADDRAGKYTPVIEEFEIDAYKPLSEEILDTTS